MSLSITSVPASTAYLETRQGQGVEEVRRVHQNTPKGPDNNPFGPKKGGGWTDGRANEPTKETKTNSASSLGDVKVTNRSGQEKQVNQDEHVKKGDAWTGSQQTKEPNNTSPGPGRWHWHGTEQTPGRTLLHLSFTPVRARVWCLCVYTFNSANRDRWVVAQAVKRCLLPEWVDAGSSASGGKHRNSHARSAKGTLQCTPIWRSCFR